MELNSFIAIRHRHRQSTPASVVDPHTNEVQTYPIHVYRLSVTLISVVGVDAGSSFPPFKKWSLSSGSFRDVLLSNNNED